MPVSMEASTDLDQGLPLVEEVAPSHEAEALGRGADLAEDGVFQVVLEHSLVVTLGLAVT